MDLPQTAAQLYALAPEAFTAARDEAAKQARAEGDRALARDVAALHRPTLAAWLVNLLVRDDGDLLEQLLGLGPALAEAQRSGEGEALRDLGQQRRQLVAAVADRAVALAERTVSAAQRAEVEATLEAALADPGSADAVRSGSLVRPLAFAGFGGVDLEGAIAAPVTAASPKGAGAVASRRQVGPGRASPGRASPDRPAPDQAARDRATRELGEAEAAALAASGALDDAARACERAARAREDAARVADDARAEVEEHRAALAAAEDRAAVEEQRSSSAAQEAEDAVRAVAAAQDAAERARATLDRLRRA